MFSFIKFVIPCLLFAQVVLAQGYDDPLTIQGLDRTTMQSAASRAAGGTTIGMRNDVSLMFSNPASLQSLSGIQISIGGVQHFSKTSQVQQFGPLKYYSNFSLLMEGLTGYIPDPDSNHIGGTPGDTVQRPYDTIGPNWSRSKNVGIPIQFSIGLPGSMGGMPFTVAFGAAEYADLRHYYQNNNVLSPSILSVRPFPLPLPSNVATRDARWYQYSRARDGSLRGTGLAFAASVTDKISLGVSGLIISGKTDDQEQHTGRGRFTFYGNFFRLDSMYSRVVRSGTSEFDGSEFTLSGMYSGQYVTFGVNVKPPSIITRSYSGLVMVDTGAAVAITAENFNDEVRLPWRGTMGLSIAVRENLRLAFEYEVRSYALTEHRASADTTYARILEQTHIDSNASMSATWLSGSVFHVGMEYEPSPWLVLRAGIRGQAEVFEQEGNPIAEEPVTYSTYSAGFGVRFSGVRLNVAYEYGRMKYQDVWGSAVSLNNNSRHAIVADLAYEIPLMGLK